MWSWRDVFLQVHRKHLAAASLALFLLALSGLLSFQNARRLISNTRQLDSIHATISRQRDLLARLNEAESGLFGYIITGQSNYLATVSTATNFVPLIMHSLKGGMEGHDDALQTLARLDGLIVQRLAMMRNRIEVQQKSGPAAAAALVTQSDARLVMEQIRATIETLTDHENDRLQEMERRALAAARTTLGVDVAFGTLSVVTLATILALLMRENVGRRHSENELRKAGRELEMRVVQRTADLASANASLQREIAEHKLSEEALRASEQKLAVAAEALEEKNRDLEMLIYVASHDLRSPLLNVRGFVAELLNSCSEVQAIVAQSAGKPLPADEIKAALEEVPESAEFIQAAVVKMDVLLNGFLRLSRLGRAAIRMARVDMNGLLDSLAQSFEFQLRGAGGQIRVAPLPRCSADAVQLTQVFSNLIDNAIKYRDRSRPLEIDISGEFRNGRAIYRVRDNGVGIPPEHSDKVFEIFHRVNPSSADGEGLGLTIARRILDRLNGRLSLETANGVGSVFVVTLPAEERQPSTIAYSPDALTASAL